MQAFLERRLQPTVSLREIALKYDKGEGPEGVGKGVAGKREARGEKGTLVGSDQEDFQVAGKRDSNTDSTLASRRSPLASSGPSSLLLDVSKDKCPSPHSLGNKLARVAWAIVWGTLFRWSPRILFGWRRFLLRCFGAKIGRNARISPSVRVWAPWNLTVRDEAAIAHLLTVTVSIA